MTLIWTHWQQKVKKNENDIEKEFAMMQKNLQERKQALLDKLNNKKEEREKELSKARDELSIYEERCVKGMKEIGELVQTEEEGDNREQQCEKIAREIAKDLPIIFDLPYHIKFSDKDISRINKLANGCGEFKFTELSQKTKIDDYTYRDIDRKWLNPKQSSPSPTTPMPSMNMNTNTMDTSMMDTNIMGSAFNNNNKKNSNLTMDLNSNLNVTPKTQLSNNFNPNNREYSSPQSGGDQTQFHFDAVDNKKRTRRRR